MKLSRLLFLVIKIHYLHASFKGKIPSTVAVQDSGCAACQRHSLGQGPLGLAVRTLVGARALSLAQAFQQPREVGTVGEQIE